jgi:hypothetical protein
MTVPVVLPTAVLCPDLGDDPSLLLALARHCSRDLAT